MVKQIKGKKMMKDFKEQEIKHIELIQAIINRMNSNSFSIKGWAITIV